MIKNIGTIMKKNPVFYWLNESYVFVKERTVDVEIGCGLKSYDTPYKADHEFSLKINHQIKNITIIN